MDERLVGQFDWSRGTPTPINLCLYSIILAREDRDEGAQYPFERHVNAHLAKVLHLGFTRSFHPEVVAGDYLGLLGRLNTPQPPWFRRGIASQIGDQLLFFSSLSLRVGATPRHGLSLTTMKGIGQQAYTIASSNSPVGRDEFHHELYACLAEEFKSHQAVLELAGHILGFEPEIAKLIATIKPVITIDNVLDAISAFKQEPTTDHWDILDDYVRRRAWVDPNFRYTMPPRPSS